ncbi:MAG: DinB family protein [Aureispira sp.]|nr:DinB family protein [Aureispira sp.]
MKASIFLTQKKEEVQAIIDTLEQNFSQLPLESMNWQESPKKWSVAQCFEHLNIYCDYYFKVMKDLMDSSPKTKGGDYDCQSSWLGRKSIESVDPKNKKKIKTMGRFNPKLPEIRENGIQVFLEYQQKFLGLLKEAEQVNINKIKVPIEFFKLLKLRLGDCIEFMVAHQQRHMQQALNVLTLQRTAREAKV